MLQRLHLPSSPGAARWLEEAAGERTGLPFEMPSDPDPDKQWKNDAQNNSGKSSLNI